MGSFLRHSCQGDVLIYDLPWSSALVFVCDPLASSPRSNRGEEDSKRCISGSGNKTPIATQSLMPFPHLLLSTDVSHLFLSLFSLSNNPYTPPFPSSCLPLPTLFSLKIPQDCYTPLLFPACTPGLTSLESVVGCARKEFAPQMHYTGSPSIPFVKRGN